MIEEVRRKLRALTPHSSLESYREVLRDLKRVGGPVEMAAEFYRKAYVAEKVRKREAEWLMNMWRACEKLTDGQAMHEKLLEWDYGEELDKAYEELDQGSKPWRQSKDLK